VCFVVYSSWQVQIKRKNDWHRALVSVERQRTFDDENHRHVCLGQSNHINVFHPLRDMSLSTAANNEHHIDEFDTISHSQHVHRSNEQNVEKWLDSSQYQSSSRSTICLSTMMNSIHFFSRLSTFEWIVWTIDNIDNQSSRRTNTIVEDKSWRYQCSIRECHINSQRNTFIACEYSIIHM
jgi:hypothetical protein